MNQQAQKKGPCVINIHDDANQVTTSSSPVSSGVFMTDNSTMETDASGVSATGVLGRATEVEATGVLGRAIEETVTGVLATRLFLVDARLCLLFAGVLNISETPASTVRTTWEQVCHWSKLNWRFRSNTQPSTDTWTFKNTRHSVLWRVRISRKNNSRKLGTQPPSDPHFQSMPVFNNPKRLALGYLRGPHSSSCPSCRGRRWAPFWAHHRWPERLWAGPCSARWWRVSWHVQCCWPPSASWLESKQQENMFNNIMY